MWSTHGQFLDWLASRRSFKHRQPSRFSQSRVRVLVVSAFHLGGGSSFSFGVGGGLLPVKTETTYECVSGFIYVFQRTGSSVTLTWLSHHLNCYSSLAQQLSFVSTASLFPVINSFFFFNFYFYFILLYNTVLVLPYIDMNPPWVLTRESVFCFERQGHQGLEDSFTVVSTACVRLVS